MLRRGGRVRKCSAIAVSRGYYCTTSFIASRSFSASTAKKDEKADGYRDYGADESANCDSRFGPRGEDRTYRKGGKGIGEGEDFSADDADGGICRVGGGGRGNEGKGRGAVTWGLARESAAVD